MSKLNDFIDIHVIPAVYSDPATLFGGEWKQKNGRMICTSHVLTDGRTAHRGGEGSVIKGSRPHLIFDATEPSINSEVITWYQGTPGQMTRKEAAIAVARMYGIYVPPDLEEDSPERRKRYQQRKKAEQIKFASTPQGQSLGSGALAVKTYLSNRGITDETAAEYGICYINANEQNADGYSNYKTIKEIIEDRTRPEGRPGGLGTVYNIAVPLYTNGQLCGYCLTTDKRGKDINQPKYKFCHFDDAGTILYGLRPAKYSGTPWRGRTLVAVEGVFDMITAAQALKDTETAEVAAYLNASITQAQAAKIFEAGYNRVLVIPDYEGKKDGKTFLQSLTEQFAATDRTQENCYLQGLSTTFVNLIDKNNPEEKQDANSFILKLGRESFISRIEEEGGPLLFLKIGLLPVMFSEETDNLEQRRNDITDFVTDIFAKEPDGGAAAGALTHVIGTEIVKGANITQGQLSDLINKRRKDIEKDRKDKARELAKQQAADTFQQAANFAAAGNIEQAAKTAARAGKSTTVDNKAEQFTDPTTYGQDLEEDSHRTTAISLPWKVEINTYKHPFNIVFCSSGISVISAPSSHGKTRIMENIIAYLLPTIPEGKTLYYIHFEESNFETLLHLVSIMANQDIAEDNWGEIRNIMHGGSPSITDDTTPRKVDKIKEAIKAVREWKDTRRLIVVDNEPPIETISEQITAAAQAGKVFAVFIDYAQKLESSTPKNWDKKSLMEYAFDGLNTLAKNAQVPIIIASQLNRQAVNPWCLDPRQNGDATNIEQAAYLNLLVWNSKFEGTPTNSDSTPGRTIDKLKKRGFEPGTPGHLAIKVAKNRLGQAGDVWAVLEFCERTGRIWQEEETNEQTTREDFPKLFDSDTDKTNEVPF